jgi:hypothetical protein
MISFLAKLLGSTGTGGIWVYLGLALAVFGAGTYSGDRLRATLDAPIIANLNTAVATAEGRTKDAQNALLAQQRQTAIEVANADAAALAQRRADAATAATLGAKLAQAEAARRDASLKLLDTLRNIPHDQQTATPPSVRAYFMGVHDQQTAAGAGAVAGPDHN